MTSDVRPTLGDPLAELERSLIAAYLAGAGEDYHSLVIRTDQAARTRLAEAARYASEKLTEIELKWRYLDGLKGHP